MTGSLRERLIALIEPLLGRLGYELVDLEYAAARAHGLVRLYIDAPTQVTLEDCAQVSREVSTLLDVEDPIPSAYTLGCPRRASSGCCAPRRTSGASSARACSWS